MRKLSRKICAVTLSVALVVTSVTTYYSTKNVKADATFTVEQEAYTNDNFATQTADSNANGTNLVTKKEAVTVTTEQSVTDQNNIKDGNKGSQSTQKIDGSWTVDLGEVKDLKELQLAWASASPTFYAVALSTDGNTYYDAASVRWDSTLTGERLDKITLTEIQSARYIKVKVHNVRYLNDGARMLEFSAFGGASTNQVIKPAQVSFTNTDKMVSANHNVLLGATNVYQNGSREGKAENLINRSQRDPHWGTITNQVGNVAWIAFELKEAVSYSDIESLYITWFNDNYNFLPYGDVKVFVADDSVELQNPIPDITKEDKETISTDEGVNWTEVFSSSSIEISARHEDDGRWSDSTCPFSAATPPATVKYVKLVIDVTSCGRIVGNEGSNHDGVMMTEVSLFLKNDSGNVEAPTTEATTAAETTKPGETTKATETTKGAETTKAVETTKAAETTVPTVSFPLTPCIADDLPHENGGYSYYVGASWSQSTAKMGVDPTDTDHVQIQQVTSDWKDAWSLQLIKKITGLTSGNTYTASIDMYCPLADGSYRITGDKNEDPSRPLIAGIKTLSAPIKADEKGQIEFVVGLGWVGTSVVLDFSNVRVTDASGNVVYPTGGQIVTTAATETTTASTEPTTVTTETTKASTEPTTASTETTKATTETTTASTETTTASTEPTTASTETTTVAGETTTASTETTTPVVTTKADVKKPGKATVATASKKKAAKKAKISLKKVARAKGYEVKISTNKKFKKSNTITKTVKKVSFTVKKLKANKKYYVKARAYVLSGKTKKFGAWSNVKRMTLK